MTIGDKIGEGLDPKLRNNLLKAVLEHESLLSQLNEAQSADEVKQIEDILRQYYEILNHTLSEIAAALKYPRHQWEWKDSRPLEEMLKVIPGLHETNWWALQMNAVAGI